MELITTRKFDIELILAIVIMFVAPSIGNKNVSLTGHTIRVDYGVLRGVIWKFIKTNK